MKQQIFKLTAIFAIFLGLAVTGVQAQASSKVEVNIPFEFSAGKTTLQPDQYFQKDVLLLDTVGELTEFFNAADLAFVGGSLVDAGGHNILEPARYRKPVLFGPYMENFRTIAEGMKRNGGAIEVHGAEDLAHVLTKLLADPEARQRIGQSAADFAAAHQEALTKNLSLATRYL